MHCTFGQKPDSEPVLALVVGLCRHGTQGDREGGVVVCVGGEAGGDLIAVLGRVVASAVGAHTAEKYRQLSRCGGKLGVSLPGPAGVECGHD
ncbi:hypothetical protein ME763_37310 (plasmid) [Streptomyces murinus]|uniref:hypothetical protein n=1 Tax=Streptomyces murinus TaxID=33900 RepID=UPI0015525648|nr:hypothetical protein [Streptomyces murinus]WDO11373.1 hypothetical protein ME763_37310 [Streptomyces murinus]